MKTCFIFNPRSGRHRRNSRLLPALQSFIAQHKLDATLVVTERPYHATELARAALDEGCSRIVAVGGDGTMNEVAQALLDSPAALALIPCGSGNGLALHLGIPTQPIQALQLLADPNARVATIDTGTANGHPFFNAMGVGFDAEISRRFNQLTRRGLPAYATTTLKALRTFKPQEHTIHANGRSDQLSTMLIAVANSDQYGNNAVIAPGARVDDGHLDLIAVRPVGFVAATALALRLFLKTFDQSPHVLRLRGARFVIERNEPGLLHTDGETHETSAEVEIVVRPRSLRLLVPANARVHFEPVSTPAELSLH